MYIITYFKIDMKGVKSKETDTWDAIKHQRAKGHVIIKVAIQGKKEKKKRRQGYGRRYLLIK